MALDLKNYLQSCDTMQDEEPQDHLVFRENTGSNRNIRQNEMGLKPISHLIRSNQRQRSAEQGINPSKILEKHSRNLIPVNFSK